MANKDKEPTVEVFGYTVHKETSTVQREQLTPTLGTDDYGCDPIGDGTFRMVPSGDIVDAAERKRRLVRFERL